MKSNPVVKYKITDPNMLKDLTPRQRQVIQMRCAMGEYYRQYTFFEIGVALGDLNESSARRIEKAALAKLGVQMLQGQQNDKVG